MRVAYITACYIENEKIEKVFEYILKTSRKFNIDLKMYGMTNGVYTGWINIKIADQLEYLYKIKNKYTHVLYTDGRDAFFMEGAKTIEAKYRLLGSPRLLMSASKSPQWTEEVEIYEGEDLYVHSGGYIGEIDYVISILETLKTYSEGYGDDSHVWKELSKTHEIDYVLDKHSNIFQVVQNDNDKYLGASIVHLAGGYSDPITGKLDRLKKYYEAII